MGTMADVPMLHPSLEPLAFLLGAWQGSGHGDYPTIKAFAYRETASYTHVGKPFIIYTQWTQHPDDGTPMHTEAGYLRPVSDTRAEVVLSQPSGILEVHEVLIDGTTLEMTSTTVLGTPTAKPVAAVARYLEVEDATMRYTLEMAAMDLQMQFHLAAELGRD
jgi:THAP4-like, heme-binding beta-barrel domain